MSIDSTNEDSWPDRLADELKGFRTNQPGKGPSDLYLEHLEATIKEMGGIIVELRKKVRALEGK